MPGGLQSPPLLSLLYKHSFAFHNPAQHHLWAQGMGDRVAHAWKGTAGGLFAGRMCWGWVLWQRSLGEGNSQDPNQHQCPRQCRPGARAWMSGGRAGSAGGKGACPHPMNQLPCSRGCFYKFAELWWIKAPVSGAGCCKFTRLPNLLEKYRENNCLQVNAGLKMHCLPPSRLQLND